MDRFVQYFGLPLQDSVLVFSLVLAILLFTPILFNKLRIPAIVGLILAGALLGPNGLGVLAYDKSFELFGQVGVLYLMFLAGIDVDINEFKQNRYKSIVFGMYTFWIPMILGVVTSLGLIYLIYDNLIGAGAVEWLYGEPQTKATVWKYSFYSAVILASCYASNTLLSYPIVNRYGVSGTRSVSIAVAGTMITTVLALLVLAVVVEIVKGELGWEFWLKFAVGLTMFLLVLGYIFPLVGRWFFKRFSDNVAQYIFVLAMVFLGAFLAKLAGIEYIIGAFLAGISLNKLIPKRSPLMNRIDFVGNAIFIPFFLISVGMIVDFSILFKDAPTIIAAVLLSVVATLAKWLAAWAEEKTFKMRKVETTMMFGLTNAQAAATLAAAMIAYYVVLGYTESGEPIRLLPTEILNGIVIMILVTCTISSIATERAAKQMALETIDTTQPDDEVYRPELRILIPVSNPYNIESLMELAVLIKEQKEKQPIYSLSVVDDADRDSKKLAEGKRLLEKTAMIGAASDNKVKMISRYDLNIATGICNVVREKNISDIIIGLHNKDTLSDSFFGNMADSLLENVNRTVYIYHPVQPLNTVRRVVVAAPALSEIESGFKVWCNRLATLSSQVGADLVYHCNKETAAAIRKFYTANKMPNRPNFVNMHDWRGVETISASLAMNDLFVAITARKQSLSYQSEFDHLPEILSRSFQANGFIVLFPEQFKEGEIDRLQESHALLI